MHVFMIDYRHHFNYTIIPIKLKLLFIMFNTNTKNKAQYFIDLINLYFTLNIQ